MMQHTHRRRSSGAAGPISKAAFKPEGQAGSPPPRIVFGSQCLSAGISYCLMVDSGRYPTQLEVSGYGAGRADAPEHNQ